MTPEQLMDAIGQVFVQEDYTMRDKGHYASLGPQVAIFDAFAQRDHRALWLSQQILKVAEA
jgi:hypothetical protein